MIFLLVSHFSFTCFNISSGLLLFYIGNLHLNSPTNLFFFIGTSTSMSERYFFLGMVLNISLTIGFLVEHSVTFGFYRHFFNLISSCYLSHITSSSLEVIFSQLLFVAFIHFIFSFPKLVWSVLFWKYCIFLFLAVLKLSLWLAKSFKVLHEMYVCM